MQPTNWRDMEKAIFWCSCRANAKSAKPPKPCANPHCAATTKSCPCSHACRTPSNTKSSTLQAQNAASCWRPTSPKPRSLYRASNTSSTPASRVSNAIPHGRKVEQLHVEKISQAAARQTLRPLRTRLRRRVYPTVFRRRFQQPPRIHRPRNRPQQPRRRHPAHGSIKLGDVAAFPFLEMPDSRYINDGFQVLLELGAVEAV